MDPYKKNRINFILNSFKFPSEFRRPKLFITDLKRFKASDYRSFSYYLGVVCLYSQLKSQYYENFLAYVTAMRLLTDEF